MALHLMGAGPKGRKRASDQRKRVISYVRFGGFRLRFRASIASYLSNAPLWANAANSVTGYDETTLIGGRPCRP
jgi:hypothetical protein